MPPRQVAIGAVPLPLMLLDAAGRILQGNERAQEAIGHSERKLIGRRLADIFSPEAEVERLLDRVGEDGCTSHDLRLRDSGLPVTLHLGAHAQGMAAIFVPEAHRIEEEHQFRRREMAEAAARIALEMAHEVKNPLASLKGAAQWLEGLELEPDAREAVERILGDVNRIRDRIDAFLQIGPRAALKMEMTNIHALIQDVIRYPDGIQVERVFDPSLPETLLHAERFRQALENLWRNAVEAADSYIEWQTRIAPLVHLPQHQGAVIEIRITNDGPGVPAALQERLFDPYVTGKERGSGLGLALVERVMIEHGGRVTPRFERGRTSMILHLPVRMEDER